MNTLAILGSGRVAATLADKLSAAGHRIVIGTRNPTAAPATWTGRPVAFALPEEAVRRAPIVINATPGGSSLDHLSALREALHGRILVDVSNAPGRGVAEPLQLALPGTRVVKTLNTMHFAVMADPRALNSAPRAFVSGDDPAAKSAVAALLADLGWPPDWIEDLGDITTARGTEAVMLLVPALLRNRGLRPFAITVAD
ncbi:NADPH-dependent F420 reductase [Streptomyces silvisoli]|uniref:NAD(P)-binding domain-containing protein n=1 Tax=Streptomyces silvisoli TaxID=3034235 RepID=A0ABT5ZNM0_9ACTN|nr:NAD(P)-binding domain-containing protein [Streptomyces silvisoli]MDF3291424.1 NAD(P)-binding domain-containing protein [Streptomyces silvisoli]